MERNRVRRQAQVKGAVNRAGAGTDQMKLHEEGLMSAVAGGQIVNRLLHRAEIAQRDKDTETPSVGHRRGAVVGGGPSGFSPDQNLARPRLSLRELYSYERYRARKSMLKRRFETVGKGSVRARRQAVLPLMEKLLAKFLASFSDLEEWSDEQETLEESWHSRKFVEIRVDPTTHVAFLVLQGMGPEYDVMVGCVKLLPARPFARPLERDRDRETGSLRGRRGGRSSSPSTRR